HFRFVSWPWLIQELFGKLCPDGASSVRSVTPRRGSVPIPAPCPTKKSPGANSAPPLRGSSLSPTQQLLRHSFSPKFSVGDCAAAVHAASEQLVTRHSSQVTGRIPP